MAGSVFSLFYFKTLLFFSKSQWQDWTIKFKSGSKLPHVLDTWFYEWCGEILIRNRTKPGTKKHFLRIIVVETGTFLQKASILVNFVIIWWKTIKKKSQPALLYMMLMRPVVRSKENSIMPTRPNRGPNNTVLNHSRKIPHPELPKAISSSLKLDHHSVVSL